MCCRKSTYQFLSHPLLTCHLLPPLLGFDLWTVLHVECVDIGLTTQSSLQYPHNICTQPIQITDVKVQIQKEESP